MTGQEKLTLVLAPKSPRKSVFSSTRFRHLFQSWHWFLATFLSSGRGSHGRMPTFFHLWPDFHLSYFFPVWVGTEREIDLFDIFWGAPPGYCPPSHCQCTFQFRLWTYNLSVWVILHKYQPRSYCYLHIPTSHFSLLFKFRVCYFQIFLWLNLIIEDFSEELTLNSRVYIRTNISGENILNGFTNQFPYKGNFSQFQIFSSALWECLQMRISDEWPNIEMLGK